MLRTCHRLRQHEALTQKTRTPHATVYAVFAFLSCSTQHMATRIGPASLNPARNTGHMADPITIRQVSAAVRTNRPRNRRGSEIVAGPEYLVPVADAHIRRSQSAKGELDRDGT